MNDKKVVELNREYWGRVHDMCAGTKVKPWECVQFIHPIMDKFRGFHKHPLFDQYSEEHVFEFAVTVLEDKPVFVGDILFDKCSKRTEELKVTGFDDDYLLINDGVAKNIYWQTWREDATWTLPAPKRTFTLNGVELPCPVAETSFDAMHNILHIGHCAFKFENKEDRKKVVWLLINLLTEARDKHD